MSPELISINTERFPAWAAEYRLWSRQAESAGTLAAERNDMRGARIHRKNARFWAAKAALSDANAIGFASR